MNNYLTGEEGELVLTAINKEALPVLRYRTKDLTTLDPATLQLRKNYNENGQGLRQNRRYDGDSRRQRIPLPN